MVGLESESVGEVLRTSWRSRDDLLRDVGFCLLRGHLCQNYRSLYRIVQSASRVGMEKVWMGRQRGAQDAFALEPWCSQRSPDERKMSS